ncbi:MAG: tRNA pseudouridine(55) synthase TruB [Nitrospiraceae bacterium]
MRTAVQLSTACDIGDGILNVNKAKDWTSHDVVAKIRTMLRGAKIGHAGTLDPAATGVLPVLVGKGTRVAEYLLDWEKEYLAVLRLGETTDTQDATGTVLVTRPVDALTDSHILEAVARFQGPLRQLPPMYSAVKVGGVPLYKAARAGRTVARRLRDVTVHQIEVLRIEGLLISLRVVCSKGTYIRTLCADIGEALGVGGHLWSLERRRVGPLTLEEALSMQQIGSRSMLGRLGDDFLSLDCALDSIPALIVDRLTADRVIHGVPLPLRMTVGWQGKRPESRVSTSRPVRIKSETGNLLAIGVLPGGIEDQAGPSGSQETIVKIEKVLVDA